MRDPTTAHHCAWTLLAGAVILSARASEAQATLLDIKGSAAGDMLGTAIGAAGDVDADGFDDVIAGTVLYPSPANRVFVYSGRDGSVIHQWPNAIPSVIGAKVGGAGDVNGDGYDDVFFTVDGLTWNLKTVEVRSGLSGTLLKTFSQTQLSPLSIDLASVGDVNGDGIGDVVFGDQYGLGVKVYAGNTWQELWYLHSSGQPDWKNFGRTVAGVGDIDRDGSNDFAAGAEDQAGNFNIRVFSGQTGLQILPKLQGDKFRRAGDANGDGWPDIVAWMGDYTETVRVYSGKDGAILHTVVGPPGTSGFGGAVDGGGDVNGDGFADFVVGSSNYLNPNMPGHAYVYSGVDASVLMIVVGTSASDRLGQCVAMVGDINADGTPDVGIGAPLADSSTATDSGRVLVVSGVACAPTFYCTAKVNSLACVPAAYATGSSSMSGPDTFHLRAKDVLNNKQGILAWAYAPSAFPFAGGTLCLQSPIHRTDPQLSGGNPPPLDCSGSFDFHFSHAYMQTQGVGAGDTIYAQFWYRDPGFSPPLNVGLTDGVVFAVCF